LQRTAAWHANLQRAVAQFWCLLPSLGPQVVELMASEKGWSRSRARSELQRALDFLKTFEAPPAPAAAVAATA
jgi:hypothetical protein